MDFDKIYINVMPLRAIWNTHLLFPWMFQYKFSVLKN
jgi:hypothetical protein